MSFDSLALSAEILKAVAEQGYDTPTPIQAQAIPAVLAGKDVMAAAQTGTGKTAGFTLPILQLLSQGPKVESNNVRTLILTPTRELAAQIEESVATYGKYLPLKCAVVFGGVKINPQMIKLRRGVDVLVATPGRLLDLYNQNAVKFSQLEILVLDEADRMLDMGFINDIRKILKVLPKKRQNLLFSATFSNDIRNLAKGLVNDPVEVSVSPANTTVDLVDQLIMPADKSKKPAMLAHLIQERRWNQVLVFTRTKHGANRLTKYLEKNKISAAAIHGNKSQGARTRALAEFKSSAIQVLVATDIAARGLDIDQLPHVVNFDLPNVAEDYVHRIGRTGRAGSTGEAVSLVSIDEFAQLADIERLIKMLIPRQVVEGFEPEQDLPASSLDRRPVKKSRPKKPGGGARQGSRQGQGSKQGSNKRHSGSRNERSNNGRSNLSQTEKEANRQAGGNRESGRAASESSQGSGNVWHKKDKNGNR